MFNELIEQYLKTEEDKYSKYMSLYLSIFLFFI